jgi:predicted ATPase
LAGGQLADGIQEIVRRHSGETIDSFWELFDWVDSIETAPHAPSLLSPSVASEQMHLRFADHFMSTDAPFLSAYEVSEGCLYILFAAALCLSQHSPKLFAVDNLDQALNPRLITRLTERLVHWLRAGDADRQLLFTAHNPAVLDGLDLEDDDVRLFAVERNTSGHTCVRRIVVTEQQRQLLTQYPLSRLWMMGNLGAVPNV